LRSRCCSSDAPHFLLALASGQTRQLEREGDVLEHGHVRVEGVVLKDHGDVPLARVEVVDHVFADADLASSDVLEPGDHPQSGRLPASRRPDEHD
jgi:hypothetical protein